MIFDENQADRWLTIRQIWGMVRVELRRYWRRRGLLLVMVLWLIGILLSGWALQTNAVLSTMGAPLSESAVARRVMTTNGLVTGTAVLSILFAIFLFAVIVADTIAYDRQLGVMEWLNALPLNLATYLLGKLCGMWASILMVMLFVMSVGGIGYVLIYGRIDPGYYVYLWSGIAGIALLVTGISLAVAAGLSSRRKAMFLGLVTAVVCFLLFIPGYINFIWDINQAYIEQAVPEIQADYCRIDPSTCHETPDLEEVDTPELPIPLPAFGSTLLYGGILLIVVSFGAWGWQRWHLHE
ncbi:MAG: ABC-2 transporter permease [Anaerolineales bacterium]|nr:ABC-2 transporter permease [Anaerolineales bacterium]